MSTRSTVQEFLAALFGDQDNGILITGRMSGGERRNIDLQEYWVWPDQQDEVAEWAERHHDEDLYFSPMLYNRRQRIKEAVCFTPGVWADCDTAQPDIYAVPPSMYLETSPGRYQAYWLIKDPVSPQWAEAMSQKVTYSQVAQGSDKGGWALTKYLRLPGAVNTKLGVMHANGGNPWKVTVHYDGAIYTPEDLETAFGSAEIPVHLGMDLPLPPIDEWPNRMSVLARLEPRADIDRALNDPPTSTSWSETLWWLECELFRYNLTALEVFVLVNGCACDKYHRDGRPEAALWAEILRAQAQAYNIGSVLEQESPDDPATVPEAPVELLTIQERQNIPRTFIDDYVEWAASRTNGAVGYQEFAAMCCLSTVLSDFGHAVPKFGDLPLNLWFMIIGVTTRTYKTTAKNLMLEVLRPTQTEMYQYDIGSDASPEGLLAELSNQPGRSVLFHRDEAHSMIGDAKGGKSYMNGFGEMLTELYDGWARGRLRATGKEKKIQSVRTRFNMMLLGVPEKLSSTLTQEDFASGFMARFLYVIGQPDRTVKTTMTMEQAETTREGRDDPALTKLQNKVLRMRAFWHRKTVPGETLPIRVSSDAWIRFNDAVAELERLADNSDTPQVMLPCADRMNKMILKLACLLAMSEEQAEVQMSHMLCAISHAEKWFANTITMTRMVGRNEFSMTVEKVVAYVQGRGRVKMATARRVFANIEPRRWNDILQAASDQQLVKAVTEDGVRYLMEWK